MSNERFHEYQTLWNGNGERVCFYQSEMPYDPLSTKPGGMVLPLDMRPVRWRAARQRHQPCDQLHRQFRDPYRDGDR